MGPFAPHKTDHGLGIPLSAQKTLEIKGFLALGRPFLDLVSQTPRPRGRGRPLFADCFVGYRTIISRYAAKWGIAQMCLHETKYRGEGGVAPFWGSAHLPEKVSRDMGYRSGSIAISRDIGPLRPPN